MYSDLKIVPQTPPVATDQPCSANGTGCTKYCELGSPTATSPMTGNHSVGLREANCYIVCSLSASAWYRGDCATSPGAGWIKMPGQLKIDGQSMCCYYKKSDVTSIPVGAGYTVEDCTGSQCPER